MKEFRYELLMSVCVIILSTPPYFYKINAEIYMPFSVGIIIIIVSLLNKIQFTQLLEEIKLLNKRSNQYLLAFKKIIESDDPIFSNLAFTEINYCEKQLTSIISGSVDYSYLLRREIITKSTELSTKYVYVTHYLGKKELLQMWIDDSVQRKYLQSNISCVKRNIEFERVFVVNSSMTHNDTVKALKIFEEQSKNEIKIYVLFENDLAYGWAEDIVIIDDRRMHLYKRGNAMLFENVSLIINQDIIKHYSQIYSDLKLRALSWIDDKEIIEKKLSVKKVDE